MVLDSSVIIKWFRQEEVLAPEALALRRIYLDGEITIELPALVAWEVANVLRFKHELTASQVNEAVASIFGMKLEWAEATAPLLARTVELAFAHETTVYDATFAALAEARDTLFVTADFSLVRRLEGLPWVRRLDDPGLP